MNREDVLLYQNARHILPSGDGGYTAIFCQVNPVLFDTHKAKLLEAGYRLYTEQCFAGNAPDTQNLFATYESDDTVVTVGYHEADKWLIASYLPKQEGFVLPPVEAPAYTPLGADYPTLLTQVGTERFHPSAMAMCYLLRAADGSFVIIDSDFTKEAADLIYDILKKQAPHPDHIVITAWIFTHPHTDHVGGFLDFAEKYATGHGIALRQVVCNFFDESMGIPLTNRLQRETVEAAGKFGDGVTFIKAHAGDVLHYADLTFRVLFTQEEYMAISPECVDANCGSVVMQMETDSGIHVLFGADHAVFGNYHGLLFCNACLWRWYDSFIESDVVTAFHHGLGGGADHHVYGVIKPKIVLWPASWNRIYNDERGVAYARSLVDSPCNRYFTDPEQAKANGVRAYYVSGDGIQILDLSNTELDVTVYETDKDYLGY